MFDRLLEVVRSNEGNFIFWADKIWIGREIVGLLNSFFCSTLEFGQSVLINLQNVPILQLHFKGVQAQTTGWLENNSDVDSNQINARMKRRDEDVLGLEMGNHREIQCVTLSQVGPLPEWRFSKAANTSGKVFL